MLAWPPDQKNLKTTHLLMTDDTSRSAAPSQALWAAVDLGSNSFRLEIARETAPGLFERLHYLKETVRLGGGLDAQGRLSPEAMQRGWQCLEGFGQRLKELPQARARAVATQTLREARNAAAFLQKAEELLGLPIAIISGREEAALIYQGVTSLLPEGDERRVVVDIGGRSTEIIIGQGRQAQDMESYPIGSVTCSQRHFAGGQFTALAFANAEADAKAALAEAATRFARPRWDAAYGASGTVGAVLAALRKSGRTSMDDAIALSQLYWLRQRLIDAGNISALDMPGIREDRKAIIGGGLSVLISLFELLGIDTMRRGHGALRHGLFHAAHAAREQELPAQRQAV